MLLKFLVFLNEFYWYRVLAYKIHKRAFERNPKKEMDRCYALQMQGKKINWENPVDLAEKTYWLELNTDTSEWTRCADKYLVRDYVKECGFEENLTKLYGRWDNAKDIDWNSLPNQFVIKTNHSCGTVIVVKDKSKLNVRKTVKTLNQWLKIPYGYSGGQVHYMSIKPCVIAEEMLIPSEEDRTLSPNSLVDYKFWCFGGHVESVWVAYDRKHNEGVNMKLFDTNWNELHDELISSDYYTYKETTIPRPKCLEQMIEMASRLSRPFPEVRVDLYVINDKPYFGELTFSTGLGFFTQDYYNHLGDLTDISAFKK